MSNYYVIYLRKNDEVVANGTATDCMKQLGFANKNSFYSMVSKNRKGIKKKYIIYIDNQEESNENN